MASVKTISNGKKSKYQPIFHFLLYSFQKHELVLDKKRITRIL